MDVKINKHIVHYFPYIYIYYIVTNRHIHLDRKRKSLNQLTALINLYNNGNFHKQKKYLISPP